MPPSKFRSLVKTPAMILTLSRILNNQVKFMRRIWSLQIGFRCLSLFCTISPCSGMPVRWIGEMPQGAAILMFRVPAMQLHYKIETQ